MIKRLLPLIALLPAAGFAADIRVSAGDMENLGIRLAAPLRVSEVAATEGSAEVVIPPAGEAVGGAPLAGLLTGLYVANGDDVTAGQVLAELRSPDFVSLQREFLDALNTERLAASELDRDRQLHAEGIISARRMQETLTRSRIAESGLNEHRQLLQVAGLDGAGIRRCREDPRQSLGEGGPGRWLVDGQMRLDGAQGLGFAHGFGSTLAPFTPRASARKP